MGRALPSLLFSALLTLTACSTTGGGGKVVKVLPHWLDAKGRHALAASLFERDNYQAHLRDHPELRHGIRFDVEWRAPRRGNPEYRIQVELRTTETPDDRPIRLEQSVEPPPPWGRWTGLALRDQAFAEAGDIIAWRVSLWNREHLLAEEKSFLW